MAATNILPFCIGSPPPNDREWQQAEALRMHDRLTELLEEIGMPRTGGPLFEEDSEQAPEVGSSLPTLVDPYVAEESGHLYITTWGGLYEKPSVLWEQRGSEVCGRGPRWRAVLLGEGGATMTTVPPLQQTAPEHSPRVRLQASDTRFFAAFADSYRACIEVPPTLLTDDAIYAAYHRISRDPTCSPRWRAGRVAGWFAALYHLPCTFAETPASVPLPAHTPRAINLQVTEPLLYTKRKPYASDNFAIFQRYSRLFSL